MPRAYEIELSEPTASRCDCCDGLTVRLTRFVCRAGDAFAIYYARYSNNHPDHELAMLVSLGEWGAESTPAQRVAFYCRVRPAGASYEVMLGDAARSAWGDAELVGEKLSREQALRHPLKATAFEIVDEAFRIDPSLRGFLQRVECGDAAVPLERSSPRWAPRASAAPRSVATSQPWTENGSSSGVCFRFRWRATGSGASASGSRSPGPTTTAPGGLGRSRGLSDPACPGSPGKRRRRGARPAGPLRHQGPAPRHRPRRAAHDLGSRGRPARRPVEGLVQGCLRGVRRRPGVPLIGGAVGLAPPIRGLFRQSPADARSAP